MTTPTPARADWPQVKALFDEVLALPPAQRREFLLAVTADDAVRAEVLSLLAHAEAAEAEGTVLPEASAGERDVDVVIAASALVGQRLGPWTLTGPLGHGGMGDVLRARRSDGAYEGQAAIKILKRGMDSAALLARFAQEQRALARLNHPHIARLFDAGLTPDRRPYFVMELVEGQPIDRAVQGRTLDERLRLFLQLADAVAYAHRQLLVHRDLKPSNVLVDGQGQVKLLDFGIAKALEAGDADAATTQQGQRPFTPHYASPEQVRGEPVGTGTDIYSLGVLLYQLLTGLRPYGRDATTPQAAARCVLEESPTKPSALSPGLNADPQWLATRRRLAGDLDNILLKALEKPIERRYATVEALAADVQAFLDGYPVSARPASVLYLLRKFVARNRWAVLAASLGGIGLATGLAAALLQGRAAAALGVIGLAGGLGVALVQGRQAMVARDLAQLRLARTRAIASDVMVRHADAIHYLPGGLKLKAELLENMIGHLDRLAEHAGGDGAFAGELAMAYSRLAELQADNDIATVHEGEASDANAAKALALFEASQQACIDNPEYSMWWARAWRSRAQAARERADLPAAMRCLERMVAVASSGLARHPGSSNLLSELGSAHVCRGQLFDTFSRASFHQPEAAMAAFAQAEAIYLRLLHADRASDDDTLTSLHQLGTIAGARMIVCANQGRAEEAVEHGLRAVGYRRDAVQRTPEHVGFRQTLATESNNLATCYLDLGDAQRAFEWSTLARQTMAALLQIDSENRDWRQAFLVFGLHHGRALCGVGRPAEALPALQALIDATRPDTPAFGRRRASRARLAMAGALQALGRDGDASVAAGLAHCELQAQLASDAADIDGWLLVAETQALLHALAPHGERPAWRSEFDASVARARACGVLNPVQERSAAWPVA
ncbi:MAG: serine/threonine-protein kinase [Burkholderiaceae bacterium]|nr:serine/threonine-protein kinase [Burkholderiaceae bacterium]